MLLKVKRKFSKIDEPMGLWLHGAVLHWVEDPELRDAMLAANLNILRREAPYSYIFAAKHTIDTWLYHNPNLPSPQMLTDPYILSLPLTQIDRGIWLTPPELESRTTTVAIEVHQGDILPFVYFLQYTDFSLLCLRQPITLKEIENIAVKSNSAQDVLRELLNPGGFMLSLIDHLVLQLITSEASLGRYFSV